MTQRKSTGIPSVSLWVQIQTLQRQKQQTKPNFPQSKRMPSNSFTQELFIYSVVFTPL